jgi:uncharacterized protein (DUF2147 family)
MAMTKFYKIYVIPLTVLMLFPTLSSAQSMQRPNSIIGTWENPSASVKVSTTRCGTELCGYVIWANEVAAKDAHEAGTEHLVGTKLLENYTQTAPSRWHGHVFVPDRGSRYYSDIAQLNPNEIKISGCILGGWVCKSQVWHRA